MDCHRAPFRLGRIGRHVNVDGSVLLDACPVANVPLRGRVLRIAIRKPKSDAEPSVYAPYGDEFADRYPFQRFRVSQAQLSLGGLDGDLTSGVSRGDCDRAILAQCPENYVVLRDAFPDKAAMKGGFQGRSGGFRMSAEENGSGENLYVEGLHPRNLCIGDKFAVMSDGKRVGLLQVSSPRRPCSQWDRKYEALGTGAKGVRHFALTHTCAGYFFRVLEAGHVCEGDSLELVERKHPKWTLQAVGDKLYGNAGPLPKDWANWSGSLDELEELANIEELAVEEWREDVEELRAKATGTAVRDVTMQRGSTQRFGSTLASKELALFPSDQPEPGYWKNSLTLHEATRRIAERRKRDM
eukprot:gnl/TRDRNA2_/TRDRNA2_166096_c0_seq2.p1 gnl/TRDRNA2_/TRDRNA2_166096_c0~~gnl/TRDRNA2_/TRDRNA2_166096_c0_seq2.p1  ORF type:complete len:355 (-),score=47.22 gnl/TRDRNA2_/TRDRNA2_166096_c0_seq2:341-1405(-)